MVRQEIATFPVLRRVGNTDDGKTNVQFLGRAAHLKLDQLDLRPADLRSENPSYEAKSEVSTEDILI